MVSMRSLMACITGTLSGTAALFTYLTTDFERRPQPGMPQAHARASAPARTSPQTASALRSSARPGILHASAKPRLG
jgi:hypothetical protein